MLETLHHCYHMRRTALTYSAGILGLTRMDHVTQLCRSLSVVLTLMDHVTQMCRSLAVNDNVNVGPRR